MHSKPKTDFEILGTIDSIRKICIVWGLIFFFFFFTNFEVYLYIIFFKNFGSLSRMFHPAWLRSKLVVLFVEIMNMMI